MKRMAKLSPRQRIALYCRDCGSDPSAPGSWRQQIGLCPMVQCPLWPERPLPGRVRPVTSELAAEYGAGPHDPAIEDLEAKGLYQEAPFTAATASSRPPEQTIEAKEWSRKGVA